jgi:hypothetical protein
MYFIFKPKSYSVCGSFRRLVGCLIVVLSLMLTPAGSAEGAKDAGITFVHKERALQPGEVVLLEVRSPQPLKYLQIEAFGRKFPGFCENGGLVWAGLIGIDLEIEPGRHEIIISGADLDGSSVTARKTLEIIAKKFPARNLSVDEKYVTPSADALARIEEESQRVNAIFASTTPERFWRGPFRIPVAGKVISAFGKRNIYNGKPRSPHAGADFKGAVGTPVRAPNAGRIVLAEDLYFSGNTIILDHGLGLYSYFAHLSAFSVKVDDKIEAGGIIGKVGATGRVTGPHLHWTVRLIGTRVNPLSLVRVLRSSK